MFRAYFGRGLWEASEKEVPNRATFSMLRPLDVGFKEEGWTGAIHVEDTDLSGSALRTITSLDLAV